MKARERASRRWGLDRADRLARRRARDRRSNATRNAIRAEKLRALGLARIERNTQILTAMLAQVRGGTRS
jgi:hypothetical protein